MDPIFPAAKGSWFVGEWDFPKQCFLDWPVSYPSQECVLKSGS